MVFKFQIPLFWFSPFNEWSISGHLVHLWTLFKKYSKKLAAGWAKVKQENLKMSPFQQFKKFARKYSSVCFY